MSARMLINGVAEQQVSALDRGMAYGDGVFETLRLIGSSAPLWSRHMQRLQDGCTRLRIPPPDVQQLWHEVLQVTHGMPQSVVRITVSRGQGERGYALPANPCPTRVVAAFAPPLVDQHAYAHGVRMRVCDLRLAEQPLLAGIKHLNRLEQVMARAEWNDPSITEGVLLDSHERVISATMANLFVVVDGELLTPSLQRCGVAGVARAQVLASFPEARVDDMALATLRRADEVFLSSSVRGIVPVSSLDGRDHLPGALTRRVQQHWRELGFVMEQAG
ncbi:aminodeoxychorismate lyase [Rhodanobacter sp. AS-Z3]|uniref:aminodeoxychorismate lyase n=1 Tax=Rhodanobacter sp. AS-Z3 TaxID=3031330 RepID=UPI002479CBE0|nr:aminodeoxychorismate lyase [Rhodanobacter sp. AS-Z3]WEN13497.1 aminodeoxychorismate lyase [Rhodanobacter sp. AS-Z3]